ncbi:GNAT family N-acetyltransferase [uncultured Ruminococcus sp.]|uniref:GNAT family N-acetyltransferase n=1 Tax=uncultured Ruminococcus sp. TaxID=165186 RepID=UPI0025EEAAB4|nr:GNAT family N-acetyltransferase [uncultured Ruminococcus sp.]
MTIFSPLKNKQLLISAVQIGYFIGRKWWNNGITSEALNAIIEFFFNEVGMERIEAIHDTRNPNSGGVMKKCGMKHECTLRRAFKGNHGIGNAEMFSILKSEGIQGKSSHRLFCSHMCLER